MNLALNHQPGMKAMRQYYFLVPLAVLATAVLGSRITETELPWYQALTLPAGTPPAPVISIIWILIYIAVAASAALAFSSEETSGSRWSIIWLVIVNGILNVLWCYSFFSLHDFNTSFWISVVAALSVLALIVVIHPLSKIASHILYPYIAWMFYIGYLSFRIAQLNV